MLRGVAIGLFMLVVQIAAGAVMAEPDVQTAEASDGTLTLVGSGWRPGQRIVLAIGREVFPAQVDSDGSFEVLTGMPATGNESVMVRSVANGLAMRALSLPQQEGPHPFAILFARSLAAGATLLALCGGGLGLMLLAIRVRLYKQRGS